jgi:hypothetical protein
LHARCFSRYRHMTHGSCSVHIALDLSHGAKGLLDGALV